MFGSLQNAFNAFLNGGIFSVVYGNHVDGVLDRARAELEEYERGGHLAGGTSWGGSTYCYTGSYRYTDAHKQQFREKLKAMDEICRRNDVFFDIKGFEKHRPGSLIVEFNTSSTYDGHGKATAIARGRSPTYVHPHSGGMDFVFKSQP